MRMGEKEERRTFSAADALWILLGVGVLVLLLVAALSVSGGRGETCEVLYVLRVRGVDVALLGENPEDLIPVGATVCNENGTAPLGIVETVAVREERRATVRDGSVCFVSAEDEVILEVSVRAVGSIRRGDGIRISDVRISAGGIGTFRLGSYYAARAAVTWVSRVGEEEA